jgi:pilus assembly protein CpaB
MRARDIIGLILALVLAVGVAFLTRIFLSKEEGKTSQEVSIKPTQITRVLVASKALSTGDVVKTGDLIWQDWPKNAITPDYLTEETTKIEDFTGSIVRFPIHKGNPVAKGELVKKGDKGILSAVVSPGMRAVSVDVTASATDSGLIFPGDYVDVIVSTTVSVENQQLGKSKTILRNIKVLAFDTAIATPDEKPKVPPHVATLEMTPAQAEVLMAGAKEGTLSLSLHSMEKVAEPAPEAIKRPAAKEPEGKKIILMRGKEKSEISVSGE